MWIPAGRNVDFDADVEGVQASWSVVDQMLGHLRRRDWARLGFSPEEWERMKREKPGGGGPNRGRSRHFARGRRIGVIVRWIMDRLDPSGLSSTMGGASRCRVRMLNARLAAALGWHNDGWSRPRLSPSLGWRVEVASGLSSMSALQMGKVLPQRMLPGGRGSRTGLSRKE